MAVEIKDAHRYRLSSIGCVARIVERLSVAFLIYTFNFQRLPFPDTQPFND